MTSSWGNKYVLIMYVYDSNEIIEASLYIRSVSHILEAYTKQVEYLTNKGYRRRVHWMDNEASASLNKYNRQEDIEYQLVPLTYSLCKRS